MDRWDQWDEEEEEEPRGLEEELREAEARAARAEGEAERLMTFLRLSERQRLILDDEVDAERAENEALRSELGACRAECARLRAAARAAKQRAEELEAALRHDRRRRAKAGGVEEEDARAAEAVHGAFGTLEGDCDWDDSIAEAEATDEAAGAKVAEYVRRLRARQRAIFDGVPGAWTRPLDEY